MQLEPTPKILPDGLPRPFPDSELDALATWNGESVDWAAIVAHVIHPVKVAIIEAVAWIGRPLSPSLMEEVFAIPELYLSLVSYHAKGLADMGVLEIVAARPARGAMERFYFFPTPGDR